MRAPSALAYKAGRARLKVARAEGSSVCRERLSPSSGSCTELSFFL
jgi:hypothetical protein